MWRKFSARLFCSHHYKLISKVDLLILIISRTQRVRCRNLLNPLKMELLDLVNASHLLGVSPNMLKRLIESSSSKDKVWPELPTIDSICVQNRSGVLVTTTLLLETLIDYIIEQANSLLDGGFSRGKESPTASDSSTTDSGQSTRFHY